MEVRKKSLNKNSVHKRSPSTRAEVPSGNRGDKLEMPEIAELFETMHFRKRMLGGVDEMDVWRQLREVQKEYEKLLTIREEQGRALLRERDAEIARLKRRLAGSKTARGASVEQG